MGGRGSGVGEVIGDGKEEEWGKGMEGRGGYLKLWLIPPLAIPGYARVGHQIIKYVLSPFGMLVVMLIFHYIRCIELIAAKPASYDVIDENDGGREKRDIHVTTGFDETFARMIMEYICSGNVEAS